MKAILLFISLFYTLGACVSHTPNEPSVSVALNKNWTVRADTFNATIVKATVPGTVHTDLLTAGLIPDPFYANNEQKVRNLESISWVYETTFEVDDVLLTFDKQILRFDGLDTYAEVYLNDHRLGNCDNMFRSWEFDCRAKLILGKNKLKIKFIPPAHVNKEKAEALGYMLPADNEDGEFKISPFTRKAPYHFGWDWGPRMVTCGIWKPVTIRGWNDAKIIDASITLDSFDGADAHMVVTAFVESADNDTEVLLKVSDKKRRQKLLVGWNKISIPFTVKSAKRWWPNGHGAAHLYSENLTLFIDNRILDEKEIQFGIRTIELVNEPDSIGTSFYFVINGEAIFIQGANYVPQDVFIPRVADQQYRDILYAAQKANMNMVRVWGGGIYEKDIFYHLCDSFGLLVWQDFMFAGTMYPGSDDFIANVTAEVTEQVRRLSKHPSLALFCGNNELEVAWKNWGWQKKYNYSEADSTTIWHDYLKLFHDIIPSIITKEFSSIDYTTTSPMSNWGTPENFNHGSMHYWGVWHGRDNFDSFKNNVGRFMVEYGMQSYPEMSTIRTFASEGDLSLDSDVMHNRQKSYIGNSEILKHIRQYFHEPKSFEEFVTLSQASQAKAMGIAISAHKNTDSHCMGSLLWQLNDCWPGPSWSIIDYYGNHKTAYKSVQKAFEVKME